MLTIERSGVRETFEMYAANSSIHGLRYLLNKRINKNGRILWSLFVVTGIICFFYIVYESIFKKFNSERFQLKNIMETPLYPVYKVNFPAVTICNYNRINWKRMDAAKAKFLPNSTDAALRIFENFLIVFESATFYNISALLHFYNTTRRRELDGINHINVTQVLEYMAFGCDELFYSCWWRVRNFSCCQYFYKQKTSNGICWTFNSLFHKDRFLVNNPEPVYPWRSSRGGFHSALRIKFQLTNLTSRPSFSSERGILVTVTEPDEYPHRGQLVLLNQVGYFTIHPQAFEAMPETKSISPDYRKCIFRNELDNNKYYSLPNTEFRHSNCIAECKRRFFYSKCGCVPGIFWPIANLSNCNVVQLRCIAGEMEKITVEERADDEGRLENKTESVICDCTYFCNIVHYDYHLRLIDLDTASNPPGVDIVEVDVHYQKKIMIKFNNYVIWTWLDYFVHVGGLASLFIGCSLMSAWEFLYFLVVGIIQYIRYKWSMFNFRNSLLGKFFDQY